MSETKEDEISEEQIPGLGRDWWGWIVAIALPLVTWHLWERFSALESGEVDHVVVNSWVAVLYGLGGKWAACFPLFGLGICFLAKLKILPERDKE